MPCLLTSDIQPGITKECVIQKEYPTAGNLGKPQRQHWDIAVIKTPPSSILTSEDASYDYLRLESVLEFGLNESEEHLLDDIERVSHEDANVDHGIIVHLYRLSESGSRFSNRDWSAKSRLILSKERVADIASSKSAEIYYGMYDITGKYETGVWLINKGVIPLEINIATI